MTEDLKESYKSNPNDETKPRHTSSKRKSPSLFGPILLIAVGVFFLLGNLGIIQDYNFNWMAVFQLWPLFLILLGINIIVKQAPQPLGSMLSALVGIVAIGILGYVLLFSEDNATLSRFGITNQPTDYQIEQIDFAPGDVETADIQIEFGAVGGEVSALQDSNSLIAGQVSYVGELVLDAETANQHADIVLYEKGGGFGWMNPANWNLDNSATRWKLGIDPDVVTELRLDSGAGSVNFDLAELTLSHLSIDGGAGSAKVTLPEGNYDVDIDHGAGSLQMTLPENGRQTVELDSGAGSITLYLPKTMAAQIDVDSGAGSFNPGPRFIQLSGDNKKDGIWQTEDYAEAENRVNLIIDMGAGSLTVREP